MAFHPYDLSVMAYANRFTLWHYTTTDEDILEDGYFNAAHEMMNVNDLLIANIDTDGLPATQFYVVTGNTGGVVELSSYA